MARSSEYISSQESRDLDRTIEKCLSMPVLILMENAGRSIAEEAIKYLRKRKRIAIFCGKGNNGGDGFVAARHLLAKGFKTDVFLAGQISDVKGIARTNLEILLKLRQKINQVGERNLPAVKKIISQCCLIIDALLGVGISGEVRGVYKDLITLINDSHIFTLSVDIPSGLDATTGKVLGRCVTADETVTFMAKKRGMALVEGAQFCGKIVVKDLGVPFCIGKLYHNRRRKHALR